MDKITKEFLDKCSQANEALDKPDTEIHGESYSAPSVTQLDIEEIFEVAGGESTTVAAVSIGVSAISA